MNPEEEFALMRDENLWKVAPLRARRSEPRRAPVWMQFVVPIVTAAVVATLVVVGFNIARPNLQPAPPVPVPTDVPTDAATPTPDPTATTPPPSEGAQVFGGECATLFTGAELTEAIGDTVPDPVDGAGIYGDDTPSFWPEFAVIPLNGGINCSWSAHPGEVSSSDKDSYLEAVILPATALPEATIAPECADEEQFGLCAFTVESNGYLLSASLGTKTDIKAAHDAIVALFEEKTATRAAPAGWSRSDGDWPAKIDCDALATDDRVVAAMGGEITITVGEPDGFYATVVKELAKGHGNTMCSLAIDDTGQNGVYADILSGGVSVVEDIATHDLSESVEVPGADQAIISTWNSPDGYSKRLFVFSGSNVFALSIGYDQDFEPVYPVATALIDALNGMD